MPKKRIKEKIRCEHFAWLLGQRNGVFFADGRSNRIDAGRHSLGTRDRAHAFESLKQLDQIRAEELGLAPSRPINVDQIPSLDLVKGKDRYLNHVGRPRVAGGAGKSTQKRYRAVFDKFIMFANESGVACWNGITKKTLIEYAAWLDDNGYAYATEYIELTTLKQAVRWFVDEGFLPQSALIRLPMTKPRGTNTYCYTQGEVSVIVEYCRNHAELRWLADVIVALATTGLRISELAALRESDIIENGKFVRIVDESYRRRVGRKREVRRTKTGQSRVFPIHEDLQRVLSRMAKSSDGRVFHGPLGGRLKADTVRRVLIRDVLKKLKEKFPTPEGEIGFEHGRLHSFRHYFCSQCAQIGVPEQIVMSWLGHSSSKMVRHYFHLHDDESQRQMRRMDFLGEASGTVAAG